MHISIGRSKVIAFAAIALAISVTAGCGGGGNSNKANSNIIGAWELVNILTPTVNSTGGSTIVCPGTADGLSCTNQQEVIFSNDGTYEAGIGSTETAAGVYNINGNVLSIKYHYLTSPNTTYTDTYITVILPATTTTIRTLYATLSTTNSPTNTPYIGARYGYGLL